MRILLLNLILLGACSAPVNFLSTKNYQLTASQKGEVQFLSFPSEQLGVDWEYGVYLPPNYSSSNTYPVIYMLHGGMGDHTDWIKKGNAYSTLNRMIAGKQLAPSIVIFPNGSPSKKDSYYVDSQVMNMESAIEQDLIPHIESRYSIKKGRQFRSIGGLSMGGYGALRFALRNPSYFGSVYILSPAIWTSMSPEREKIMAERKMYGNPFNWDLWNKQNYPELWDSYKQKAMPLRFFVACGTEDPITPISLAQELTNMLTQQEETFLYIEQEFLGHDWGTWATILPQALDYIDIK